MKKPICVYVESKVVEACLDPDCLSIEGTIFRNGGEVNGVKAVAFAEVTPELLAWLQSQKYPEERS